MISTKLTFLFGDLGNKMKMDKTEENNLTIQLIDHWSIGKSSQEFRIMHENYSFWWSGM